MKKFLKDLVKRLGYQIIRYEGQRYLGALKKLIDSKKKSIIFDVGAHHGETEKVLSETFINSSIFCFEPFDSSFSVLQKNVGKNTNIFNVGFSDSAGKFEFQSNFLDATNSLLILEKNAIQVWDIEQLTEKEKVICEFITIDEFVSSNNINQIDLLKLDVQGAEYKVLSGAKKSLTEKIIKNIYMEVILAPTYVGQWGMEQYIKELGAYGYELYGIYNMVYGDSQRILQADIIFTLHRKTTVRN